MNYFDSCKVEEGITCIKGITGELMFLLEGTERAALIDTGLGVGNIKDYVDSLTELPYVVLSSHGHLDHVGGAFLYDSIYLCSKDIPLLQSGSSIDQRREYLESILTEHTVSDDDYIAVGEVKCLHVKDGDLFDLGGFTIEAIAAPGHTDGSFCFLFKERRILFTGDACNGFTFLFLDECGSVLEYQKTVKKLLQRADEYDRVYVSHGNHEVPKSMIIDVYDCCNDIMNGISDDIIFNFMEKKIGYIAKKLGPEGGREDGKLGNIVYCKDKIFSRN